MLPNRVPAPVPIVNRHPLAAHGRSPGDDRPQRDSRTLSWASHVFRRHISATFHRYREQYTPAPQKGWKDDLEEADGEDVPVWASPGSPALLGHSQRMPPANAGLGDSPDTDRTAVSQGDSEPEIGDSAGEHGSRLEGSESKEEGSGGSEHGFGGAEVGGEGSSTGSEGGVESREAAMSSPITPLGQSWNGVLGGLAVSAQYDAATQSVHATVRNTLSETLCYVQAEPHLKSGTKTVGELGPDKLGHLNPGQEATSSLTVDSEPEPCGSFLRRIRGSHGSIRLQWPRPHCPHRRRRH